ncbi:MAG: hypothetical protein RLN88_13290 [Ekhidna sp.]|uniref:hypothetical protein n=1 Tax=Ekhidna sp. TaxID=2608089 RepID=UPI0032EC94B1
MKASLFTLLSVPLLVFGQAKTAEELRAQDLKKYSIESAEITYEITGDAEGEEVMVFTDYGWTSLKQQTMTFELYGITSTQNVHEITDGDFIYRVNPEDSTYVVRKDFKWSQQASYKSPDQVSEAILFSMGGEQQSDSTLMDKTCQVWTFEGKAIQELWVWNGLVLKRKAKLGDRLIETTATEIKLDVSPNLILFTFPEYYTEQK